MFTTKHHRAFWSSPSEQASKPCENRLRKLAQPSGISCNPASLRFRRLRIMAVNLGGCANVQLKILSYSLRCIALFCVVWAGTATAGFASIKTSATCALVPDVPISTIPLFATNAAAFKFPILRVRKRNRGESVISVIGCANGVRRDSMPLNGSASSESLTQRLSAGIGGAR